MRRLIAWIGRVKGLMNRKLSSIDPCAIIIEIALHPGMPAKTAQSSSPRLGLLKFPLTINSPKPLVAPIEPPATVRAVAGMAVG